MKFDYKEELRLSSSDQIWTKSINIITSYVHYAECTDNDDDDDE